jgi:hypothetical protein
VTANVLQATAKDNYNFLFFPQKTGRIILSKITQTFLPIICRRQFIFAIFCAVNSSNTDVACHQ